MTRSLQEILDEIALLVERGEYLDVIPGHPQEGTSGGGAYRQLPDGRLQREYFRGTPEYEQARSAGELAFLPPLQRGVATPATINAVERLVGEPVPPLLRRLYEEVANGGFGPGYGILGLGDGDELAGGGTAPELFASRSEWWPPSAPTSLVALCDWGCAVQSFVDWSDPTGPIWGLDPNPVGTEHALHRQEMNLTEWWSLWLDGRLYQPWTVQDLDTGDWRCATNDEVEAALAQT